MTTKRRFIASSIVCGVFAAGCVGSSATEDNAATVGQTEQALGATTQAQEREITYYDNANHDNEVGWCIGPYMCYGPKGLHCGGIKTAYYTISWSDCGEP